MGRSSLRASLGLAKQLNMTAVAEGVEDRTDWDLVRQSGCDEAQGYFVARPMAAGDLSAWRDTWRRRCAAELSID